MDITETGTPRADSPPREAAGPVIRFTGGEPVPPQVAADWKRYQALPATAQNTLWEIVQGCLRTPDSEQLNARAEAFCRLYEIPSESLEAAVRVAHYLYTQAARLDLSMAQMRGDLTALGEGANGIEALLANFEAGKGLIRDEIVRASLLDHGKVLVGMDWRVDRVEVSSRGHNLHAPVVMLSLRHRHGPEDGITALQLTPTALRELLGVCARIDRGLSGSESRSEQTPDLDPNAKS